MTEVELTEDALVVHVQGMDRLWALKSRLEIPLHHILGAEVDPQVAREWRKGIRAPGTHVPGVLTAGTFYQEGERVFWDVHDPEKTVVIHLRDERYARLVIEVDDPPTTAAAIQKVLGEGAIRRWKGDNSMQSKATWSGWTCGSARGEPAAVVA